MKTIKEIAEELAVHPRTVKRRIEKLNGTLTAANGGPFNYGASDVLPAAVVERLMSGVEDAKPAPAPAAPIVPRPVAPRPAPKVEVKAAPIKREPLDVDAMIFKNRVLIVVFTTILISVDSLSFGWIAWNTYTSFPVGAAAVFAVAGLAVGYSAVKNVVSYKGWNGDAWAWGFGLFQLALHLCAMEVLGELSFFFGKIVISVGLPLATAGLATALKMDK